jgi:hypothetical protein
LVLIPPERWADQWEIIIVPKIEKCDDPTAVHSVHQYLPSVWSDETIPSDHCQEKISTLSILPIAKNISPCSI